MPKRKYTRKSVRPVLERRRQIYAAGNIAGLIDALRLCRAADVCPVWVADECVRIIRATPEKTVQQQRKRHRQDMICLVRADAVQSALQAGLGWTLAKEFARDYLHGHPAGNAGGEAMAKSHTEFQKMLRKTPARLQFTELDRAEFFSAFENPTDRQRATIAKYAAIARTKKPSKKAWLFRGSIDLGNRATIHHVTYTGPSFHM